MVVNFEVPRFSIMDISDIDKLTLISHLQRKSVFSFEVFHANTGRFFSRGSRKIRILDSGSILVLKYTANTV